MKNSLLYGQCFKQGAMWADQDTKSRNLDWACRCQRRTKPREQETGAGSLSTEPEKRDLAQGRKSWHSGTVAKLSLSQFCWASWSLVPEEDVHSRTATLELIGQARLPHSEVLRDGGVMISTPTSGRYGTLYPLPPDAAARHLAELCQAPLLYNWTQKKSVSHIILQSEGNIAHLHLRPSGLLQSSRPQMPFAPSAAGGAGGTAGPSAPAPHNAPRQPDPSPPHCLHPQLSSPLPFHYNKWLRSTFKSYLKKISTKSSVIKTSYGMRVHICVRWEPYTPQTPLKITTSK